MYNYVTSVSKRDGAKLVLSFGLRKCFLNFEVVHVCEFALKASRTQLFDKLARSESGKFWIAAIASPYREFHRVLSLCVTGGDRSAVALFAQREMTVVTLRVFSEIVD